MKRWNESVSKQLSLMIFMSGILFSFLTFIFVKDNNIIASILTTLLPASWAASTALVAVKTGSEAYKNHKGE